MFGLPTDRTIALFSTSAFPQKDAMLRDLAYLRRMGVRITPLRGRYTGADEPAFAATLWHMAVVQARGWLAGQETVLLVPPSGEAWLRPASYTPMVRPAGRGDRDTLLGAFKRVTAFEAMRADGYTFDPQENTYWGVDADIPRVQTAPSTSTTENDHART